MSIFLLLFIFILLFITIRYLFLCKNPRKTTSSEENVSTLFVLGSGGHTTEMIELVKHMKLKFHPRVFIIASSDTTSESKLLNFENIIIEKIPRSREVKQSYFTSIFTTIYSIIFSFRIVWKHKPQLIVCNGPGTCIPICFWGFILKIFWLLSCKIIYIESVCRVSSLSLSGLIIYYTQIFNAFYVHWPELKTKYPKTILKFSK